MTNRRQELTFIEGYAAFIVRKIGISEVPLSKDCSRFFRTILDLLRTRRFDTIKEIINGWIVVK